MKASVGLNQNAPTVPSSLVQKIYVMLVLVLMQYSIRASQMQPLSPPTREKTYRIYYAQP